MRRRLEKFLPIVLIAVLAQIFAPIGATWAASLAASDPLHGAVICHGNAASASGQSGGRSRGPSVQELDRAAAAPVLRLEGLKSPVVIESIKLLKKDKEYFVHARSKDGAEGVSLPNPPRAEYLDKILKQLVIPFFTGKDARDLENLLWELYRWQDNYKLYGLALWSPQAWVEFARLDMLGRIARKPMGRKSLGVSS